MERFDPFGEMARFREMMDRVFEESPLRYARTTGRWAYSPLLDICEMEDEVLVRASVPGSRPEDLDVTVKEDTLTIRGEVAPPEWMRRSETAGQGQAPPQGQAQQPGGRMRGRTECWLQEIPYGRFARSITLPIAVNAGNARAEFENGFLTLHLPKAEEARPRRIEVRAGGQRQQIGVGQSGQQQGGPSQQR